MRWLLVSLTLLPLVICGCASAGSQYEKGEVAYLRADYESALKYYRSAKRKNPELEGIEEKIRFTEIRLYMQRGDQAVARADWAGAQAAYEEVRYRDPGNPEVEERLAGLTAARADHHFRRGQELLSQENPFDAIAEFEEVLSLQPDHPRAGLALERALAEKRDREERAAKAFADGRRAWKAGRGDDALNLLEQSVELDPHRVESRRVLGEVRYRLAEAVVLEADELFRDGRFEEAIGRYQDALAYDPGFGGIDARILRAEQEARAAELVQQGNQAFDNGDWASAFTSFDEALYLTSERDSFLRRWETSREQLALGHYSAAQSAELAGDVHTAMYHLEILEQLHPNYRDVISMRMRLESRIDEAHQAYADGCYAQQQRDLARALEYFRNCERSLASYRDVSGRVRSIHAELEAAAGFYDRGCAAEVSDDPQRARILFEECLAISTPYRDAAARLARLRAPGTQEAADLFHMARRAHAGRDLIRARELYLSCRQRYPGGFQDLDERLAQVERQLAEARQLLELAARAYEACDLERAYELYSDCFAACTSFEDVAPRLDQIESALLALEEARRLEEERRLAAARECYGGVLDDFGKHTGAKQRERELDVACAELDALYEDLLEAQRTQGHRRALVRAREIRARCRGFRDVDDRLPLLESEVDYLEACELEQRSQPEAARALFERCAQRTPGFRDVDARLRGRR